MQHYKIYLRRFKNWFFIEAWPFWLFFSGLILATVLPLAFKIEQVDHVYYTGFLLQFFAFFTIIIRINSLRKYFDDDNRDFIRLIIEWFKRFPSIFKASRYFSVDIEADPQKVGGTYSAVVISPEKTLEQRVADLEEKQKELEKKLREAEGRLNKRISEIVNEIRIQINELQEEFKSTKKKTKEFNADKLKIEIVWSVWLILGLTIRTFTELIGSWFAL